MGGGEGVNIRSPVIIKHVYSKSPLLLLPTLHHSPTRSLARTKKEGVGWADLGATLINTYIHTYTYNYKHKYIINPRPDWLEPYVFIARIPLQKGRWARTRTRSRSIMSMNIEYIYIYISIYSVIIYTGGVSRK